MSLDVSTINIGSQANDGTGDAIRTAFGLVNTNFYNLDTRISNGNIAVINASLGVTAGQLVSNTSVTTQTLTVNNTANFAGTITANNLAVNNVISGTTLTSSGNVNVGGTLNALTDIIVSGNLTVIGHTTTISTVDTAIQDSLIHLHTPAGGAALTSDDGKDIGFLFNYYKGADKTAALVWANDTQSLEFYAAGAHTGNVFVGTNYGNVKAGSFFAANTGSTSFQTPGGITASTASISTIGANVVTTGNLTVTNKIVGSLYIGGPGSTDTIYINGVPVATALSSFNGGPVGNAAWFQGQLIANSQVASTSVTSGAFVVDGGAGITGNLYAGGIVNTPISGSTGDFTALSVHSTFAASSVSFLGGYITNVHGDATQWTVTDFTSGNVKITGGTVSGLTSLGASGVAITSGTITGLTSLTSASATITSGAMTGLTQVTTNNLTSVFGLVTSGTSARIAGDFTNSTVVSRLLFQTTTSNGSTNISAIPRGTIASGQVLGSFRIEDNTAISTGGASGGIELYQDTELRITSTVRGTGTYLPITVYTNGTKNAQFSTNHDVTIYNTSGTGVVSLGANGVVTATSFNGRLIGLADTATLANGVAWVNITGTPAFAAVATSGSYNDLSGKPTIPAAQVNSDWTAASGVTAILNKPSLATVATSGSYTDLSNKPTIPTVPTTVSAFTNDSGYITSATLGTYGVSQIIAGTNIVISPAGGTGNVTISTTATAAAANLTGSTLSSNVTASSLTSVGTLTSLTTSGSVTIGGNLTVNGTTTTINATTLDVADLNVTVAKNAATAAAANGAGLTVGGAGATFTYSSADDRWNVNKTINGTITNATLAAGVDWANVTSKPTIPAAQVQTDWNAVSGLGVLLNKPTLATVATSGSYTDLTSKPTIPAAQVQSDWNAVSGLGVILNKPTSLPGAKYTESATAPSGPTAGDRWYNTTTDILYQYIGTSWVDVFTAGITATSTATANAIAQRDATGGAAFSTVTAATVSVTGSITTTGVGTVNIGTNANKFGTIYGTATTAQYADLAERYVSDRQYEPGTVVVFGGPAEVTVNDSAYDTRIAGVVSTNPAYLMNDVSDGLPIALTGRVPCKVIGPIRKGDVLVAAKFPGIAQAIDNSKWVPGCVIGKALEAVEKTEITTIEVVIGRF